MCHRGNHFVTVSLVIEACKTMSKGKQVHRMRRWTYMGALLGDSVCSRHSCQGHRDASLAGCSLHLLDAATVQ